jgi:astacin
MRPPYPRTLTPLLCFGAFGVIACSAATAEDTTATTPDDISCFDKLCVMRAHDQAIFEGDIVLGQADRVLAHLRAEKLAGRAFMGGNPIANGEGEYLFRAATWPRATVPYRFSAAIPATEQATVVAAMTRVSQATGIQFVPEHLYAPPWTGGEGPDPWHSLLVERSPDTNCYGTIGYRAGATMWLPTWSAGCVVHEIGHVLGLWHEQSRPDRDAYIQIHWQNITPRFRFAFNYEYGDTSTPYDLQSVMHYYPFAFSQNGLATITRHNGSTAGIGGGADLSALDVAALQRYYFPPPPPESTGP